MQKLRVIFSRCKGLGNFPRGWANHLGLSCKFTGARPGFLKIFEGGFQLGEGNGAVPGIKGNFPRFAWGRLWPKWKKWKFERKRTRSIKQIKNGGFLRCGGKKKEETSKEWTGIKVSLWWYLNADDALFRCWWLLGSIHNIPHSLAGSQQARDGKDRLQSALNKSKHGSSSTPCRVKATDSLQRAL